MAAQTLVKQQPTTKSASPPEYKRNSITGFSVFGTRGLLTFLPKTHADSSCDKCYAENMMSSTSCYVRSQCPYASYSINIQQTSSLSSSSSSSHRAHWPLSSKFNLMTRSGCSGSTQHILCIVYVCVAVWVAPFTNHLHNIRTYAKRSAS